jgi:hypothetical protein
MVRSPLLVLAVGISASLAGCVTTSPPVLSYAAKDCPDKPSLAAAIILPPKDSSIPFTITRPFDSTTPCLARAGAVVPYQVFALPAGGDTHVITAGAQLGADRTFAPDISVLDSGGLTTRAFTAADYFVRGDMLSVQFRPHPGETYLIVAVDPSRVGKTEQTIAIGVGATAVATRGGAFSWRYGIDRQINRVYAFDGSVEITVTDAIRKPGH